MSTDYQFVDTDSSAIITELINSYEKIMGTTVTPSSPDRLFIAWVADVIVKERVRQNYTGNQNIPSRAEGENLDALGEWLFSIKRKGAQAAKCTVQITITEAQESTVIIPKGTKMTDVSSTLVWATTEDALIAIGETVTSVMVQCTTAGTVGNGYEEGQINTLIDVDNIPYFLSCTNTTVTDGGAEKETDEEYYEAMREATAAHSTAGAENSYIYWAKSVSSEIADVKAICPKEEVTVKAPLYTDVSGNRCAFISRDGLDVDSMKVFFEDTFGLLYEGIDFSCEYTSGLLKISVLTSDTPSHLSVSYNKLKAGYVYIYALMNDGTIATDTIKEAIYDTCSKENVRPLTDCVKVMDAEIVDYDIDFTYYVSEDSQLSQVDILEAVDNAVNEYKKWQSAKLGRDINPDKLRWLLYEAGIKRVNITSPVFTSLRSGTDNLTPQIAQISSCSYVNGGIEDE